MACEIDAETFIKTTGLDGNSKVWDDLPPPYCYRGWHLQECLLTAYGFGFATMCISPKVFVGFDSEHLTEVSFDIKKILRHNCFVLLNDSHAVASDGVKIYDPKGFVYDYEDQSWEIICMIFKINNSFSV